MATLLDAFNLFMIHRAWCLHIKDPSYSAWENNFRMRYDFQTFRKRVHVQGSPENEASRAAITYGTCGITPDMYREFIVVAFKNADGIMVRRAERVRDYRAWKDRMKNVQTDASDFVIESNGLPAIMSRVAHKFWEPIMVAEALSNSGTWDQLWSLKDQCTFMFDIVWPKIHRYKPLFEKDPNVPATTD